MGQVLKTLQCKNAPKTKNSTNAKRANVGKSIECLCNSIAKSSEALLSPHMNEEKDSKLMQNQECKIGAIEKHSKDVGKIIKNY